MTLTQRQTLHTAALSAEYEPHLSRWLWLVKMFLAVPHFAIFVVLWPAFIATTVFAGFAILFTGRYPRALFDFNVGILRWNWRVGFYVYAALGTDRYPPFTLRDADYPARFKVAYSEHLSRRLVVVKWILALPHVILVALIMGGFFSFHQATAGAPSLAFSALDILAVIGGAFLLITATYPRPLFDLVVGVSRWVYRVLVYVAFMGDEYPPFRLDTGADEPRR